MNLIPMGDPAGKRQMTLHASRVTMSIHLFNIGR